MKHHLLQTSLACILMLLFFVRAMAQMQETTHATAVQHADKTQRTIQNAPSTALAQYTLSEPYTQSQPVNLSLSGLCLVADSGSLIHDVTFSVSTLTRSETQPLSSNMLSVTAGSHAYRLLPHGEHFRADQPARIELAYEPLSVPHGFKPQDIHTYYFDEQTRQWQQLRRIATDITRHVVISETTHFTDFVNAVIRTPDMPEVNAFVPTTLTDMEDPHPLVRVPMIAAPEANTYGTASITYPIDIPAGRNGLQPDLTLSYSSDRGNGIMGVGWSFPQPAITLDTRWGVPRYDTNKETEIYTLNGLQLVQKDGNPDLRLPYQTNTRLNRRKGNVLFIARDPKNADRIIRHGNSPKDYYWTVTDRSGTTYYYGKYAADKNTNPNCVLKDANGNIAHWALAEVVDLYGNYMRYEYVVSSQKEIYPKFIYYTGHRATNGTIDLTPSYRVFFHYDQRADIQKDGRLGFVRQTDSILCYIDIAFLGEHVWGDPSLRLLNHRYLLYYDETSSASLLNQIQDHFNYFDMIWSIEGDCSTPLGYNNDKLNTTTRFDYYTAPIENIFTTEETILLYPNSTYTPLNKSESDSWSAGGVLAVGFGKSVWNTNLSAGGNYNFSKSDGKTEQMLLDMNGDGLTDIVYIKNSHICFRPQRSDDSGVYFGDEINTGIPATGLSADVSKTHTWGLQAGAEAFGANANVSGGMSHSETYTTHYFADINGDGLPDYVADGKVYFNRINSHRNFLEHMGEDSVRIDSSQCATNFYYDGEVEVIPDCVTIDTIISSYYYSEKTDCSPGYTGTEPKYTSKPQSDYWDCDECVEALREYVKSDKCTIELYSQFATRNCADEKDESMDSSSETGGKDYWGEKYQGLQDYVLHCLSNCGIELVCKECLEFYELHKQYPGSPDFLAQYEYCKQENGCRTLCSECVDYLLHGDEDGYLACADTYCLSGALEGMANPCDDCREICIDDIKRGQECIYDNPTCFVCKECRQTCIENGEDACNDCKLEKNCLGGMRSDCGDYCERDENDDFYTEEEWDYLCTDCLINEGSVCPECYSACHSNPQYCYDCLRHRCRYSETDKYIQDCRDDARYRFNKWKNDVTKNPKVKIEQRGNWYYAHLRDTICPEPIDPDIDAVRVWVAPKDGTVTLQSSLQLIQDTGYGRSQSRQADGVQCVIQLDRDVTVNTATRTLHSQRSTILGTFRITENDYAVKEKTYTDLRVKKGDVFFFHVRSVRTHNYDNVRWNQVFTYSDGTSYSSDEDFICSSDEVFQTGEAGSITLDADIMCQSGKSAVLRILLDGRAIDSVAVNASVSRCRRTFSYLGEASVSLVLHSQDNLGQIEVRPQLTFTPAQQSASNPSFSRWLAPQMVFTREVQLDSTYYHLFGPLYRGWGQFGYNNTSATDAIRINSLVNTAVTYAQTAPADSAAFCQSITFTASDTTQLLQPGGLDEAFSTRNLYNPLDNAWIQMTPDASRYSWEAYGHVARNGRDLLSNTRDTEQELARMETETESTQRRARSSSGSNGDVEFDSDVPVFPDGQRATAVRKVSKTTQWNVNIGAGISLPGAGDVGGGYTHSQSDYTVTTDFMDMNGDGYPDVVRSASIQYTNPWGGLGENKSLATEMYNNHTVSNGGSLSGNYAYAVKAPGVNVKDGKFLTHVSGSVSGNATTSESGATIAYIDINGDGLPDKLVKDTKRNTISACLNIGYDFTSAVTLADLSEIDLNKSTCWGGSAGLGNDYGWGDIKEITKNILGTEQPTLTSKFQVSLAFGADMNWSENRLSTRLVDMNGDGIPDVVKQTDDGVLIMLMSAQGLQQQTSVRGGQMQCSKTFNWNVHTGITAGVPIWFVKICIGANGSPKGKATTQGTHDLIDMNGDGLPDLVWTAGDGIHIRYNQTGKNRLLRTVTNPTGQQFLIDYELSAPSAERRGRQWLMSRMCNIDPYAHPVLGCDTMMQQFDYADPHYDYAERQFLGYGATTTHDINTETTPHATYRKVVRRYNNTEFVEYGKLTYEGLSDAEDRLFHEYEIGTWYVDSAFTLADNLCADASIRIGKEVHYTRYYEGGEDRIVTAKRYEYDKYHNVREYVNMGDSVLTDDDLRATIEYDSVNITTYNLVSSPSKMVVYSNGTPTREIQVAYQKGQPVEVRRTDLLNTRTDTTNYHYDAFGLPDSVAFPANYKGERAFTTVQYDAYSHTLPVRVADQWGRTQQMRYDKFLQLPYYVTDPSGNKMKYEYDTLGRLVSLYSPLGDIKYNYVPRKNSLSYIDVSMNGGGTFHRTFCDARGDMVQRFDQRGSRYTVSNRTARDCFGRTITTYANVWADSLVRTYHTHNLDLIAQTDYDVMDRATATYWADGSESFTSYEIGDDAFGVSRLLQNRTDENGNEWLQYSSPQGWLTTSVAPDEATTTFRYDPLGQLLQSTDPDGLTTTHTYDGFGRRTKRVHPDAGTTRWTYDAAGNMIASATQVQLNRGEQTTYEYDYNRISKVHYPCFPQRNISYGYDSIGRLSWMENLTGTKYFEYDAMGNISLVGRVIVIPSEYAAYHFTTKFDYDAFGRMLSITYPDGERVNYTYRDGLLRSVNGNAPIPYIQNIDYDEYDNPVTTVYGNGMTSHTAYDEVRRWPIQRDLQTNRGTVMQDLYYYYDFVGNITGISQSADRYGSLGGSYYIDYYYDGQNRLIEAQQSSADIGDYNYTMTYSPSGLVGQKKCNEIETDITFGYRSVENQLPSHRPCMALNEYTGRTLMSWDANGQMTNMIQADTEGFRHHLWDEAGQLTGVIGNEYCGYYGYDGDGERVFKLTGTTSGGQYNASSMYLDLYFDDVVMYVSPYMVVTPKGYTKHYYNGSQRIAARLGDYWNNDTGIYYGYSLLDTARVAMEKELNIDEPIEEVFDDELLQSIDGEEMQSEPFVLGIYNMMYYMPTDMLSDVLYGQKRLADDMWGVENGVYFYHPDHLGSSSWITDDQGHTAQYIHYMPYGEIWKDKQESAYSERFWFTGKERDSETGYDYFGARYYLSLLGIWLSPDPLLDKSPNISSYVFCGWNPLKYMDPDGNEKLSFLANTQDNRNLIASYETYHDSPNVLSIWGHGAERESNPDAGAFAIQYYDGTNIEDFNTLNVTLLGASSLWQEHQENDFAVVVLHACKTGKGKDSFAKRMSADPNFKNVLIIAPNNDIAITKSGKELGVSSTKTENDKLYNDKLGEWVFFMNGKQVNSMRGDTPPIFRDIQKLREKYKQYPLAELS